MEFAFITPVPLLNLYATASKYHLLLEHLTSDEWYVRFYSERKSKGDFIILDNSIIEVGNASSLEALDEAAQKVTPDEIALGEKWHDAEGTLQEIEKGIRFAESHNWNCGLMAVPQGSTLEEWLWCFERILALEIDTIGIPKFLEDLHGGGRLSVLRLLEATYGEKIKDSGKQLHLLGLGGNPIELAHVSQLDLPIRGADSSMPVWFGLLGIPFHPDFGLPCGRKYLPPIDFYSNDWVHNEVVKHNIEVVKQWCSRGGAAK
ncbi:MAG: hypothetical protein JRE40_11530 [Deltaproteobacteria bacterium]|nr:hypothetical protein [Deltaproteobacteria bacterium]